MGRLSQSTEKDEIVRERLTGSNIWPEFSFRQFDHVQRVQGLHEMAMQCSGQMKVRGTHKCQALQATDTNNIARGSLIPTRQN